MCDEQLAKDYFNTLTLPFEYKGCIFSGLGFSKTQLDELRNSDSGSLLLVAYPKSGTNWLLDILTLLMNECDQTTIRLSLRARCDGLPPRLSPLFSLWRLLKASVFHGPKYLLLFTLLALQTICGKLGIVRAQHTLDQYHKIAQTHIPVQFMPKAVTDGNQKVIYCCRNPKDTTVSYFHFLKNLPYGVNGCNFEWEKFYKLFRGGKLLFGCWFEHVLGYYSLSKTNHNILFLRFEDMKKDLKKEVRQISEFLGAKLSEEQIEEICRICDFGTAKKLKLSEKQQGDLNMETFMRKGMVGDWKNHFTVRQSREFDKIHQEKMKNCDLRLSFAL